MSCERCQDCGNAVVDWDRYCWDCANIRMIDHARENQSYLWDLMIGEFIPAKSSKQAVELMDNRMRDIFEACLLEDKEAVFRLVNRVLLEEAFQIKGGYSEV
jgi:hypothetical protein